MDERGLLPAHARAGCGQGTALYHRHPAAEHHGRAAHGPRPQRHHPGHLHPPRAHAGASHALDPGHRPRRHLHADQGGQEAGRPGHQPPGDRPRGVHRGVLRLVQGVRHHHREPDQGHGLLVRLRRRALHAGAGVREGRAQAVRGLVPRRPHLQGQAHRELVPALHHVHLRRRGRVRGRDGPLVVPALPADRAGGRSGVPRGGHDAPRDDAGRHGRGGEPEGRALQAPRGQDGEAAAGGPRDPHLRRLARGHGVRHRLREDHARARPERLGHGRAQRPRAHQHLRRDGARGRRLRPLQRHGPRRGARSRGGRVRRAGPAGQGGGPRPLRHDVLPLPHEAGALGVRAVVRGRRRPQAGRGARGGGRLHPVPPRALEAGVPRLAGQPQGLVHLAPAVVGPSHPHVLLR